MTVYPSVHDEKSLRDAVGNALAHGSACVAVPLFNGSSHLLDDLVREGIATGYTLWVEISLSYEGEL